MLFDLTKETFRDFVHKTSGYVLIEFYGPTCKSCQTLLTILEDISDDYYGKIKVFKINCETESELADLFDIFSLPTMILFEHGSQVKELTGLHSYEDIESWLSI
jgi:thioredoxin